MSAAGDIIKRNAIMDIPTIERVAIFEAEITNAIRDAQLEGRSVAEIAFPDYLDPLEPQRLGLVIQLWLKRNYPRVRLAFTPGILGPDKIVLHLPAQHVIDGRWTEAQS